MTDPRSRTTDSRRIAELYQRHGDSLLRYVGSMLKDSQTAADVVQATFVKLIETGGPAADGAEKAWLFRVAYHQALALRRRQAVGEKATRKAAGAGESAGTDAAFDFIRREEADRVRRAIRTLPQEQREVVRLRIYENKTFAEIAGRLDIPLGTALTRMRTALKKLRAALADED